MTGLAGGDLVQNENVTSVVIPDNVTDIEYSAFEYCTHLTRVAFGKGLTSIHITAFAYCESLDNVTLPDNLSEIESFAFFRTNLTSIIIPVGVKRIEESAFCDCSNLSKVTILAQDLTIEYNPFSGCSDDLTYDIVCNSNAIDQVPEYCRTLIHNRVTDPAVAPSYEAPGLTEGSHCTVCGTVFKAQESIPQISLTKDQLSLEIGEFYTLSIKSQGDRTVTWSSSDASVASVADGTVTGLKEGNCTVTATLNDGSLTCDVTVRDTAALSSKSLTLNVGETGKLTVSDLAGRTVAWSSSDSQIATVNAGQVTAVKGGTCTVTAKLSNGKELTCNVTVKDPAKLSEAKLTLTLGKSHNLKVSGLVGRTVTWSSSDKKVATVKAGKVTAVKAGTCTITAQVNNGKKLTCKVTVKDPAKLSETKLTLILGKTHTLKASGLVGRTVTWASSNINVATVKGGKITTIKPGKCTIIAQVKNGKRLTCTVTVKDGAELSANNLYLYMGEVQKLTVNNLAKRTVTWSSSNKNIATVNKGTVTPVSAGSCTVTAKVKGGKKLTCKVTVIDRAKLSTDSLKLSVVDAGYIELTGAANRKVTWTTSNSDVVKIAESDSNHAVIHAVSVGEATITARLSNGKTLYCAVTVLNPITVYRKSIELGTYYSDVCLNFVDNTNAKIVYVECEIRQYNNRGDLLESPYSYYYINDDINSHSDYTCHFWVNRDTKSTWTIIKEITFEDGRRWKP